MMISTSLKSINDRDSYDSSAMPHEAVGSLRHSFLGSPACHASNPNPVPCIHINIDLAAYAEGPLHHNAGAYHR